MPLHLEVLVEEPSAKAVLREVLPKILPPEVSFDIHAHQGKLALLRKLPARLAGYAAMRWSNLRLMVLLDRDQDDCGDLKATLEERVAGAGLVTKSRSEGEIFQVVTRIAVEELEAWFFGDVEALRAAFPRVPGNLASKKPYRDPDAIRGGTSEALGRVLHRAGHYDSDHLPKIAVASAVGPHMEPARNRSRSFRCFCEGVRALTSAPWENTSSEIP
jgi:hypothetical protein